MIEISSAHLIFEIIPFHISAGIGNYDISYHFSKGSTPSYSVARSMYNFILVYHLAPDYLK